MHNASPVMTYDLLSNQNDISVNLIMSLHLIVLYTEKLSRVWGLSKVKNMNF